MTAEDALVARAQGLADDHTSGASALARQAVEILEDAIALGPSVVKKVGVAVSRAQPAMAAVRNAAALAVGPNATVALRRLQTRMSRAPKEMSRVLTRLLLPERPRGGRGRVSLATISCSGSVAACLAALTEVAAVRVICGEGRPLYEGRLMAASLAQRGIAVTLCTDAAIGAAVREAADPIDAVVVGADAVTPQWFLNKCGTHVLAAAAASVGVPVYVVASRAAFLNPHLSDGLAGGMGPAREVWDAPPDGVSVLNPYFETVPLELVSRFITDVGPIGAGDVGQMCESIVDSDAARRVRVSLDQA